VTLVRRPRLVPRVVPGRLIHGPVPVVQVRSIPEWTVQVPVVLVPAVPPAEGRPAGGLAAGGHAGSPAWTASPAGSATQAVSPSPMAHRARAGRREPSAMTSPVRLRRADPARHVDYRRAALTNSMARPAQRGRPRRR